MSKSNTSNLEYSKSENEMWSKASEYKKLLMELKESTVINEDNYFSSDLTILTLNDLQVLYRRLLLSNLNFSLSLRIEDDLWALCFKDYISYALSKVKGDKKSGGKTVKELVAKIHCFLESASGFYLTLLSELRNVYDWDFPFLRRPIIYGQQSFVDSVSQVKKSIPYNTKKIGTSSRNYIVQHILIHLGDISRYKNQRSEAHAFYSTAQIISPTSGQSYNQIGLLEYSRSQNLASIYFYIRSLCCLYPFSASYINLSKSWEFLRASSFSSSESSTYSTQLRCTLSGSLNGASYIHYFLVFSALLSSSEPIQIRAASEILRKLNESLTPLIALEAFGESGTESWIQILAIALYLLQRNTETSVTFLLLDFLSGSLNAFLLPIYTSKQGKSLVSYFALPLISILLTYIGREYWILESKAFVKRPQIWPSLSKMLNELSTCVDSYQLYTNTNDVSKYEEEDESRFSLLPEEQTLRGFEPYKKYTKIKDDDNIVMNGTSLEETEIQILRAVKILGVGRIYASSNFPGKKYMELSEKDDGQIHFTALEQNTKCLHIEEEDEEKTFLALSGNEERNQIKIESEKTEKIKETEKNMNTKYNACLPVKTGILKSLGKKTHSNVAMEAILKSQDVGVGKVVSFQKSNHSFSSTSSTTSSSTSSSTTIPTMPTNTSQTDSISCRQDSSNLSYFPPPNFSFPPPPSSNSFSLLHQNSPLSSSSSFTIEPKEEEEPQQQQPSSTLEYSSFLSSSSSSYSLFSGPSFHNTSQLNIFQFSESSPLEKLLQGPKKENEF